MTLKSIIGISGRISAGKSYASNLINQQLNFPVASFGRYLVDYCIKSGLGTDRLTLQDVGENFINTDPELFLENVINHFIGKSDTIIIEGIRHKVIFESIKKLTQNYLSIFIEADQQTRYSRYFNRNKDSDQVKTYEQFLISDNHIVELEIESLKPMCDIIFDTTKDHKDELVLFITANLKL